MFHYVPSLEFQPLMLSSHTATMMLVILFCIVFFHGNTFHIFANLLSTLINILLCEIEARSNSVEKSDDARYYNTIERCSFFDNKARKIIIKLPLITQLPNPSIHVSIHNLCLLILSNSWNHHLAMMLRFDFKSSKTAALKFIDWKKDAENERRNKIWC